MVEAVEDDEVVGDCGSEGIGTTNDSNALGRSHAPMGTTYDPTRAMTQAHRVARPA